MLTELAKVIVANVKAREAEGDCPTTAAYPTETLEDALLTITIAAETGAAALRERLVALEGEVHRVQSDREYIIGFNAGWEELIAQLRFPTMLRKMWSGGEVQKWIDEHSARDLGASHD